MTVAKAVVAEVQESAKAGVEVCGALLGQRPSVRGILPLPNRSEEPASSFRIAAEDVLSLERSALKNGNEVIGFYHSHPSASAKPSARDLELAVPGYIYLIVSSSGDARAWRLRDDWTDFEELQDFILDDT